MDLDRVKVVPDYMEEGSPALIEFTSNQNHQVEYYGKYMYPEKVYDLS